MYDLCCENNVHLSSTLVTITTTQKVLYLISVESFICIWLSHQKWKGREEGEWEEGERTRARGPTAFPFPSSLGAGIGSSNALRYNAHIELRKAHFLGSFAGLCERKFVLV